MISREQAIETARNTIVDRGLPWEEPIHVWVERKFLLFGQSTWVIRTNANSRGNNVLVRVNAQTGVVERLVRASR
jgi:hypothetical protein